MMHQDNSEDERLLASLVLQLSRSSSPTSLQKALNRNDCKLLLFIGRLINAYNNNNNISDETIISSSTTAQCYAFLRLAVHVAFLRYADSEYEDDNNHNEVRIDTDSNTDNHNNKSNKKQKVAEAECEQFILTKLLPTTLRTRSSFVIEEVDIEIALIMRGIVMSLKTSRRKGLCQPQQQSLPLITSQLWIDYIESLMERRMHKGEKVSLSLSPSAAPKTADYDEDNRSSNKTMMTMTMVQTIHSILDEGGGGGGGGGGGKIMKPNNASESSNNVDSDPTCNKDKSSNYDDVGDVDWDLEFDKLIVDCIHSFLQHFVTAGGAHYVDGGLPRLKQRSLLRMIQLSQQQSDTTLAIHAYSLVLQYLSLYIQYPPETKSMSECFVVRDDHVVGDKSYEECTAAAIRSFVFYGMVVLGNSASSSLSSNQYDSTSQGRALSMLSQMTSLKGLRSEIYTITMNIWRLFGPNWLFNDSNYSLLSSQSSTMSTDGLWWFRSKNVESQLGLTWPFCTFVQLAAGDLRLNLGRWITVVEDGNNASTTTQDNEYMCSEIQSCASIILETVQLMTNLADDDEGDIGASSGIWVPEALLHIRQSLEDALNASVQYLNSFSCDQDETLTTSFYQASNDEVGRICCVLFGTIASELEIEDLLISPNVNERRMQFTTKEEADSSCFVFALRNSILLCQSMGEKNAMNLEERLETCEPLCCILPCIMSVVSCCSSSNNEQVLNAAFSFCRDACLLRVICQFIHRAMERWKRLDRSTRVDEVFAILSIVRLCLLIVEESVGSLESIADCQQLKPPLNGWKAILSSELEEAEDSMKKHIAETIQQIDDCLIILETYQ